jgi:hypothetical protein
VDHSCATSGSDRKPTAIAPVTDRDKPVWTINHADCEEFFPSTSILLLPVVGILRPCVAFRQTHLLPLNNLEAYDP